MDSCAHNRKFRVQSGGASDFSIDERAAESGKISAVFVFSIKHISQNHDLAFELVDRLNELGVIVYDNEGYQYSYDWYCKQIGKRFVGGCR